MKKILLTTAALAMLAAPAFATMDKASMKMEFDKHDMNKDGALSKSEWDKTGEEMWMKADANKDGKVTLDEKMALMQAEHGKPMAKDMDSKKAM